jgi:transcriptional regulator with XRE-family HTH domain
MTQDQLLINGDLLRLRREARGWALNDMATRACMSTKQIRQLEEGGMSSFYSEAVKVTAAKKVGALLGLSADEVFAQEAIASADLTIAAAEVSIAEPEIAHQADSVSEPPVVEATIDVAPESSVQSSAPSVSVVEDTKSKTSLWIIAGLFAAALAVAAYLQPQDEPVVEPAPPLQTMPTDATDAASAASASDAPASAVDVVASSALPASASRVVLPVASAGIAPVVRSASATAAVVPATPVASK